MHFLNSKIWVLICPKYPPDVGGASSYYQCLNAGLSQSNSVVCLTPFGSTGKNAWPILVSKSQLYSRVSILNILRVFYNSLAILFSLVVLRFSFANVSVLCHSGFHSIGKIHNPIWSIANLISIKVIFDLRDRFLENRTLDKRVYVTCIPDLVADNITYIPLPMNLETLSLSKKKNTKNDEKVICWIGEISDAKRIKVAISIFKDVQKFNKHYRLKIIGPNMLGLEFLEGIKSYDFVDYMGVLCNSATREILAESDLLLFTSVMEGMPRTVLEALEHRINFIADKNLKSIKMCIPEACKYDFLNLDERKSIVDEIINLSNEDFKFMDYDITKHAIGNILQSYERILK